MTSLPTSQAFRGFYHGKKVLVTGATGFKGAWLCAWLQRLGAEVSGLSLDIPTEPSLFKECQLDQKIEHHFGDIRNYKQTLEIVQKQQPEIVFHLAAQSLVLESYENPLATYETNVMGTMNVMEAVRQSPSVKTVLVVTSDKCYENLNWNFGYREDDRLGGHDPYSSSKAACEIAFSSFYRSFYAKENRQTALSARAGNVIGGGDWAENRIVPDCMRSWKNNEDVVLRNPSAIRPWQHVLESLCGYLHIVQQSSEKPHLNGESYNGGPSQETYQSVEKLVEELQQSWPDSNYIAQPHQTDVPKEAQLLTLSCEKIFQQLQWQANLDFSEGVRMTGNWYFQHSNGKKAWDLCQKQIETYETLAKERSRPWASQ